MYKLLSIPGRAALVVAVASSALGAQQLEMSAGVAAAGGNAGVGATCFEYRTRGLVQGRVGVAWGWTDVALTARAPVTRRPPECVSAPLDPSRTHQWDSYRTLLAEPFTAFDARWGLRKRSGVLLGTLSLGAGNAFRHGDDVPYVVSALGGEISPRDWLGVRFEVEVNQFRVERTTYRREAGIATPIVAIETKKLWQPGHVASVMVILRR